MILILDNLRSAHNVGSLLRSADGAGVTRVYLVGITPGPPVRRTGIAYPSVLTRAHRDIIKTALGAEESVSWMSVRSLARLITRLRQTGYEIVALEEGGPADGRDYRDWRPKHGKRPALIVGNEVTGLGPKALALADTVLALPMRGAKHSLNVSVAGGIALYHLSATIEKLTCQKNKRPK